MASTEPVIADFTGLAAFESTWKEGTLILMYHAIEASESDQPWTGLYVEPKQLRIHMSEFVDSGVPFIRADDLLKPGNRERRVLVTLDDGFQNVFINALPIFQEFNVTSLAYIVAGELGGSNTWDHGKGFPQRPLMSRSEICKWVAAGQQIGAHTMTHPYLAEIPLADARREIFDSKKILEDLIGQSVRHFCYPYGSYNADVEDLVKEAGFETATSVIKDFNFPDTDLFALRRIMALQ